MKRFFDLLLAFFVLIVAFFPMMLITFSRVIILQCSLTYFFIVVLAKDVVWAWYAITISCIISGLIAYFMRLYFVDKLKEKL